VTELTGRRDGGGRRIADAETRRGRRRPSLWLRLLVSIALLVYLLRTAGLASIFRTVVGADPRWLAAGLGLGIVAAGLQANQWRGLLAALGLRRSYRSTLHVDTAARVFDAALPSSIGGDVLRIALVAPAASERVAAALSVILRRVMQLPGLVAVLVGGAVASLTLPYAGRVELIAFGCAAAGVGLALALVLVSRLESLRRVPVPRKLSGLAGDLAQARTRAAGDPAAFVRAALRGLLFWCVVVLSQTCFIVAVGIHVPLGYATAVIATVNALSLLPISLGGYGLREGTFSALLAASGQSTLAQGAAVGACLSLQTLAFGVVGGLVYLTLRKTARLDPPSPAPAPPVIAGAQ